MKFRKGSTPDLYQHPERMEFFWISVVLSLTVAHGKKNYTPINYLLWESPLRIYCVGDVPFLACSPIHFNNTHEIRVPKGVFSKSEG